MMEQLIAGIVAGIGYSLIGWQKVSDLEDFDYKKMIKSVIICGIVGGITGFYDMNFNVAISGALGIAVTNVVNIIFQILKVKFARFFKPIKGKKK